MNVINRQRRAIEAFAQDQDATPAGDISLARIWTTDGSELFPRGISNGLGTCSDIHGMDVLVVEECPPEFAVGGLTTKNCAYTVEVRQPTPQELENYDRPIYCLIGCVELLKAVKLEIDEAIFKRTGKYNLYPRTVT